MIGADVVSPINSSWFHVSTQSFGWLHVMLLPKPTKSSPKTKEEKKKKPRSRKYLPFQDCGGLKMAAGVIKKFFIASMFMWIAPLAILYGFNHNLLPGSTNLSPHAMTLVSGFVAVISVNIVIAFYIYMAMKEPSDKHEPDPKFLADAKASVSEPTGEATSSSQSLKKQE
ncbi:hypothetical protein DITRI_Ditri15bG0107200 [Diplodiscus trichospermus]